jgi:hypothetical protein
VAQPPAALSRNIEPFAVECRFLLGLGFENLFDPTGHAAWFRCKGCTAIIRVSGRFGHWKEHRDVEPRHRPAGKAMVG